MLYWLKDVRYVRLAMPEMSESLWEHDEQVAKQRTRWRKRGQHPDASVNIGPDASTMFLSREVNKWILSNPAHSKGPQSA
jgi:hypothetical protein